MSHLTGEFEVKIDAKGRMMIPAGLKKKLPAVDSEGLVINRGFENYLVIYPNAEWEKQLDKLSDLNQYEEDNIEFIRYFTRGATELSLDTIGRVNLPQGLLDYAGIKNDVILSCQLTKIEVWDKAAYDIKMNSQPKNFAKLAAQVMGDKKREGLS